MQLTIEQLAERLSAKAVAESEHLTQQVTNIKPVDAARSDEVTFAAGASHIAKLAGSSAAAVLVNKPVEGLKMPQLVVPNVNAALIETLKIFAPVLNPPAAGVDPSAIVATSVKLGQSLSIGPHVVIEDGAQIGDATVIAAGCRIGQNTKIGKNCRLDCNVVIYHNCLLGSNVIVQANTTIGSTGFGYSFFDGAHHLIPHNGGVIIEDFVEIGANSCIDRAKFDNTVIGAGTKIDNLVQIAHNVVIGRCCLIAGQVGIAGSTRIGNGVVMAGSSGVTDNVAVGDGVMVGARSTVLRDVKPGEMLFGTPAEEKKAVLRQISATRRLPKLLDDFRDLTRRIEKLEAAKNNKT